MADFRTTIFSIDEGGAGAISWAPLLSICTTCCQLSILPADLLAALIDRLKSEATYVVLNTLTALHTLCLNSKQPVHDQLVNSKVMKYLERLLNKPPFPGVEMAAAQLLMDWAFLYGQEELGHRSFAALTSTSKHRAMLQSMAASDVAVMLKEDQKLGLPQFCSTTKGLDFQKHFTTQLAGPLTGNATPPGVASQLAKAAVAASYSDSAAAVAAAAASRNTFAAWAERVAQDPQAAAQRVLDSHSSIQADLDALEAAQEACAAAARECAKQQPLANSISSSSSRPQSPEMVQLRHQLDKAYLAACKANEWREMTEVLVQQRLPDTQLSALLSLADKINSVLDGWQQAATTEVFWLLGVNTAGLADGSILWQTVAAATAAAGTGATVGDASAATVAAAAAPATAAAATAAAQGASQPTQQQVQQQSPSSLLRGSSSYLDLLTGDTPAAMSTTNPFVNSSSMDRAPVQAYSGNVAAAGATDELQQYLQELGVAPTNSTSSGSFSQSQQQQRRRSPAPQQPQPQPHRPAPPPPQQQQQQQHFTHYPAIGGPPLQQQGGWLGSAVAPGAGPPPPQQQQRHPAAIHSMDRVSSTSSSSDSARAAKQTLAPAIGAVAAAAAAGPSSTGAAGAAAATVSVAAGDTGSSSDSAAATCSYTNPFASLDTRTMMRGMKGSGSGPVTSSAGMPGAATSSRGSARSSMDGSSSAHSHAPPPHHQQQQQQHGRLLVQPQDQEPLPAALAGQGSSPLAMQMPLSPPAAGAVPQLQLKVQQLFQRLSGGGHPASSCDSCGLPDRSCLEPAVLQLLLEQQHHHELQLQHLQHQHQTQVAEIKAMAVQRFKELQQQLAAHKQ